MQTGLRGIAGARTRTAQPKLRDGDVASVKDFGAPNGVNDTAAFSAAAQAAFAKVNIQGTEATAIARAAMARVLVPGASANYILTSTVDTGGREVTWVLDQGAAITGYAFLNGRVVREGQRITDSQHHGTTDYACTFMVRAHADLEDGAEISGYQTESDLATFDSRDSVAFYSENNGPALLSTLTAANYTATSVVPGTPISANNLKLLRVGMIIDTAHSPKYSGFITGWAANGSSITVEGWYQFGGGGSPATPSNGVAAYINPFNKVWAHNANASLHSFSHANELTGFELGVINNKAAYNPAAGSFGSPLSWGYDAVSLGAHQAGHAFIARENFYHGYTSYGQDRSAFYVKDHAAQNPDYGLYCDADLGAAFLNYLPNGVQTWLVSNTGTVEAGAVSTVQSVGYDFHTSGNNNDYDSRISASGGAASVGQGTLELVCATLRAGPQIQTGSGVSTGDVNIEMGGLRTGDGNVYIDFHARSGTDYECRFLRNGGVNGTASFANKGTGDFSFTQEDAGAVVFKTNNIERLRVEAGGALKFAAASFAANGAGTVTIGNLRPAGAAIATITCWLTFNDDAGVDSYIPVWQ